MTPSSSRAPRADAARNREKLLTCARSIFAKCGPDASVSDIAKAAGVGQGTAFRHFPTKDDLLSAAMNQHVQELLEFARGRAQIEDPWEALAGFCAEVVRRYRTDRAFLQSVKKDKLGAEAAECMDEFSELVNAMIERAKVAGLLREDVVESDFKLILTAAGDVSENVDAPDDASERILQLMLDGLRARA